MRCDGRENGCLDRNVSGDFNVSLGVRKKGGVMDGLEVCGLPNQDRELRWGGKIVVLFLPF